MKGLVVEKNGEVSLAEDIPVPEINEYQALVRTECCMICNGTDMEIIEGSLDEVKEYPVILGHEGAGTVVKTGNKVKYFYPGDRVIRVSLPDNEKYRSGWGSFAEYGVITDAKAMIDDGYPFHEAEGTLTQQKVDPRITSEQAALMITLKETCSAIERSHIQKGDHVVIVGDGPVGLCMLNICMLKGIDADMIGNRKHNLNIAKLTGAKQVFWNKDSAQMDSMRENKKGIYDYYIDTVGTLQTIQQGISLVHEDGSVIVYGLRSGKEISYSLDGIRNIDIRFVQWPIASEEEKTHQFVQDAVLTGRINTDLLISHRLKLEEYQEGLKAIREKRALKVALFM